MVSHVNRETHGILSLQCLMFTTFESLSLTVLYLALPILENIQGKL